MWYQIKNGVLHLNLKIKPNAKQTAIVSFQEDYLKVNVHAPPVDGAANKELIRFLAETFKVPKSNVNILHGENSRIKKVALHYRSLETVTAILNRLSTHK